MRVKDLIDELSRMPPQLDVKLLPESVYISDEAGEKEVFLDETHATLADSVQHAGGYVLIRAR